MTTTKEKLQLLCIYAIFVPKPYILKKTNIIMKKGKI